MRLFIFYFYGHFLVKYNKNGIFLYTTYFLDFIFVFHFEKERKSPFNNFRDKFDQFKNRLKQVFVIIKSNKESKMLIVVV